MENKYNVDQLFYYYLRNEKAMPIVTICIVRKGDNYARGMAICSPYDMPVKAEGRRIARNRALKALFNMETSGAIYRDEAVCELDTIDESYQDTIDFDYKTEFMPKLTVFEQILFGIIERGRN